MLIHREQIKAFGFKQTAEIIRQTIIFFAPRLDPGAKNRCFEAILRESKHDSESPEISDAQIRRNTYRSMKTWISANSLIEELDPYPK